MLTQATSNIASTMVAPAMEGVSRDLEITNMTLATLAVSIYLLGFALGPLVISSLSEMYGRLIVYHVCNTIFVIFVVACALSKTTAQFIIFRFITGCAGAAPLSLGGGTIADVIPIEKRGAAAALFGLGPLLGPVRNTSPLPNCSILTVVGSGTRNWGLHCRSKGLAMDLLGGRDPRE